MAMEKKVINQKEYLKKYISFGDDNNKKKKKKKKSKTGAKTVKIIDDDIDLRNTRPLEEGEFDIFLDGEDAPQIAGIVDERGPVDFTDKKRWKIITENEEGDLTIITRTDRERRDWDDETNINQNKFDNLDLNLSKSKYSKTKHTDSSSHRQSKDDDSDLSLFRQSKHSKYVDVKSSRRFADHDSDLSSPRQHKNYDSDLSPARQSRNNDSDLSSPRQSRNNDSDLSPPRQSRNNDSDLSPPRQSKNNDSDLSPSRKRAKHRTSARSAYGQSSGNKDSDSDFSPPRKRKQNPDADSYESRKKDKKDKEEAYRRKEHRSRKDNSPHRSYRADKEYPSNSSGQAASRSSRDRREREREYDDHDRKSRSYSGTRERRKKSRWGEEPDNSERRHTERDRDGRMTKTLDGKTAGLQDAKALREETRAHKQREAEQFNKLSKTVSGVGQTPIVRDRTGRKRNLEAEAAEKREREIQQREINEKYAKWGKGLKQVEDREEKLKNDLYEMNKPLARYADDADLDRELREQEREGDPMLKYIKQKQIKEGKRNPDPPQYQGSYAPNRFGIKPGHRWDGVDRSNGYEKKWFEAQNAKVARQEEAYKWSTADM